ncbi:MAG: hypothetical protein ABJC04_08310 [Verrucomicrobiota bacterium]
MHHFRFSFFRGGFASAQKKKNDQIEIECAPMNLHIPINNLTVKQSKDTYGTTIQQNSKTLTPEILQQTTGCGSQGQTRRKKEKLKRVRLLFWPLEISGGLFF